MPIFDHTFRKPLQGSPLRKKLMIVMLAMPLMPFAASPILAEEQPAKAAYAEKNVVELSGRVFVSGSGSYNNPAAPRVLQIEFFPGLNYFVRKNWYLGADLGTQYSYQYASYDGGSSTIWQFWFLPSVSFGFAKLFTEKLYWFAQGALDYSFLNCSNCLGPASGTFALGASGGVKYDTGSGLIAFGAYLRQSGLRTGIGFFMGLSVYF